YALLRLPQPLGELSAPRCARADALAQRVSAAGALATLAPPPGGAFAFCGGAAPSLYHLRGRWGCEWALPLALPTVSGLRPSPPLETPKASGRQHRGRHRRMPLGAESGRCVPRPMPAAGHSNSQPTRFALSRLRAFVS